MGQHFFFLKKGLNSLIIKDFTCQGKVGSYRTLLVVLTTLALQCLGVMGGNKSPAHTPTVIP